MVIPYPNEIAGGDVSLRFLNVKNYYELKFDMDI